MRTGHCTFCSFVMFCPSNIEHLYAFIVIKQSFFGFPINPHLFSVIRMLIQIDSQAWDGLRQRNNVSQNHGQSWVAVSVQPSIWTSLTLRRAPCWHLLVVQRKRLAEHPKFVPSISATWKSQKHTMLSKIVSLMLVVETQRRLLILQQRC